MTITSPVICFGTYNALERKQSAAFEYDLDDIIQSPFYCIDDLKLHGRANEYPYATFEPDYWLLDGSYKIAPTSGTFHTGIIGSAISDSSGVFGAVPTLLVAFDSVLDIDEMIFEFSADYPAYISINFYDASDTLIDTVVTNPDSSTYTATCNISACKWIEITFNQMTKGYRRFRLLDIDFCAATYFAGDEIKNCNVIEQIDLTSLTLPFNTLDFHLFTDNPEFSIIAPAGGYTLLQDRQPLYCYEIVDGTPVLIGKFFLDTWENLTEKEIVLRAIDLIGLMDKLPTRGFIRRSWDDDLVADLLNSQLTYAGIDYELDSSFAATHIEGALNTSSYREMMQQICIAIGAYCTCSRSDVLRIKPLLLADDIVSPDYTITNADIGDKPSLSLKTLVTGVEVMYHTYTAESAVTQVYKNTLGAGTHTVFFDKPIDENLYSPDITGATITVAFFNRAIIVVSSPGVVTISGKVLVDNKTLVGIYNPDTSIPQNVISIENAYLVGSHVANEVAQRLYDYFQQRYLYKPRLYAPSAEVGNSVYSDTTYVGRQIAGIVEKMELDLSGGFRAKTEIVGIVLPEA